MRESKTFSDAWPARSVAARTCSLLAMMAIAARCAAAASIAGVASKASPPGTASPLSEVMLRSLSKRTANWPPSTSMPLSVCW